MPMNGIFESKAGLEAVKSISGCWWEYITSKFTGILYFKSRFVLWIKTTMEQTIVSLSFKADKSIFEDFRVFESWVLRRIFGSKRDDVTGTWRTFHNEEFNTFCSSLNIITMI
jgi:hypothetical protein